MNLSDVLRPNFFLHSQRPHAFFLTAAPQCFQLARVANFATSLSLYSCVTMGRKSSVHSTCCTLLRRLSEQLWIWCLGKLWSFDGLPNLMLKWIWCGSEGSYDDLYFRKQGATLANFMLCYQRTFCLVFALSFTSCYNSNVLPQFGIWAWPGKGQTGHGSPNEANMTSVYEYFFKFMRETRTCPRTPYNGPGAMFPLSCAAAQLT